MGVRCHIKPFRIESVKAGNRKRGEMAAPGPCRNGVRDSSKDVALSETTIGLRVLLWRMNNPQVLSKQYLRDSYLSLGHWKPCGPSAGAGDGAALGRPYAGLWAGFPGFSRHLAAAGR